MYLLLYFYILLLFHSSRMISAVLPVPLHVCAYEYNEAYFISSLIFYI